MMGQRPQRGPVTVDDDGLAREHPPQHRPAAVAPLLAKSLTLSGFMSKTTHSWPPCNRRLTILAPILPRPIIPSCMSRSSHRYTAADDINAPTQGNSPNRGKHL